MAGTVHWPLLGCLVGVPPQGVAGHPVELWAGSAAVQAEVLCFGVLCVAWAALWQQPHQPDLHTAGAPHSLFIQMV